MEIDRTCAEKEEYLLPPDSTHVDVRRDEECCWPNTTWRITIEKNTQLEWVTWSNMRCSHCQGEIT